MASNRFSVAARNKAAPQDPTQVPSGIDVHTFFFPAIPDEVRAAVPILHTASASAVERIAAAVFEYLCASTLDYALPGDFYESILRDNAALAVDDVNAMTTAIYFLARTALRNKIKLSVLREHLAKMNVPAAVADAVARQLQTQRTRYEARVIHHRLTFPKLERVRWRVDVVISSGSLTRVMRPNVLLQVPPPTARSPPPLRRR